MAPLSGAGIRMECMRSDMEAYDDAAKAEAERRARTKEMLDSCVHSSIKVAPAPIRQPFIHTVRTAAPYRSSGTPSPIGYMLGAALIGGSW